MPEPSLPQKSIRSFQEGVMREVESPIKPEAAVDLAINCHFDHLPLVTRRPGLTIIGAQISGSTNTPTYNPSADGYVARGA